MWIPVFLFYHPHPKDGEGNVFSLSDHTLGWGGGGGRGYPAPSHNTSTGPMSFLRGGPQSQAGGTPDPARRGWGTPGHNRMGYHVTGYAWTCYGVGSNLKGVEVQTVLPIPAHFNFQHVKLKHTET